MGAVLEADRRPLAVAILLSVFAIAFQMAGIIAALPTVMQQLGASAYYAWAMSTFIVGMLLSTLVAGRVADRVGPLKPMVFGISLFTVGLIVAGAAPNVGVLLLARFLQGIGSGTLNLSLFVVIAHGFAPKDRATMMAALSFMWLLPAFVGPPIAAALATVSWRLVFIAMLPLLLVAAVLALKPLLALQARLELDPEDVGRFPVLGAVTLGVGPIGLQLAGEGLGLGSVVAGIIGAAALIVGLPRVVPPAARSLASGLGPVMVTRGLCAGSFFAAEAFVILGLQRVHGLSQLQAGFALTIGSVGWTIGSWIQAQAWLRWRRDQILTLGAAMTALGMVGITVFMVVPGVSMLVGAVVWILCGVGMGVMMPSAAVATMSLSRPVEQGRNNSGLQVCEAVGNATITAVAGALFAAGLRLSGQEGGFAWVFPLFIVTVGLAVAASLRVGPVRNDSAAA